MSVKRLLAIILTASMLLSFGVPAFAEGEEDEALVVEQEEVVETPAEGETPEEPEVVDLDIEILDIPEISLEQPDEPMTGSVKTDDDVAQIVSGETTTYFASLADAIAAAQAGDVIELLANVALTASLAIPDGVTLQINSGATLDASAAGVVVSGSVVALSGATVIERMVWEGMTTFAQAQDDIDSMFPATGYSVASITDLRLNAGATEKGYLEVTDTVYHLTGSTLRTLVGSSSGAIRLTSGYLTKKIAGGKMIVSIYGNVSIPEVNTTVTFEVPGVGGQPLVVDGSKLALPLFNVELNVCAGTTTVAQDIAAISGSKIVVSDGANLAVNKLNVLDGAAIELHGTLTVNKGLYTETPMGLYNNEDVNSVVASTGVNIIFTGKVANEDTSNPLPSNTVKYRTAAGIQEEKNFLSKAFAAASVSTNKTYTYSSATDTWDTSEVITPEDNKMTVTIGGRNIAVYAYAVGANKKVAVVDSSANSGEKIFSALESGAIIMAGSEIDPGIDPNDVAVSAYASEFSSNPAAYYMNVVGTENFINNIENILTALSNAGYLADGDNAVVFRLKATLKSVNGNTVLIDIHPEAAVYSTNFSATAEPTNALDITAYFYGSVTLKIPVPAGWQSVTVTHYEDGTLQVVKDSGEVKVVNGYISYPVASFSPFELTGTTAPDLEAYAQLGPDGSFSVFAEKYKNQNARLTLNYGAFNLANISYWTNNYDNGVADHYSGSTTRLAQYQADVEQEFNNTNNVTLKTIIDYTGVSILLDNQAITDEMLAHLNGLVEVDKGAFRIIGSTGVSQTGTADYTLFVNTSKDQLVINAETDDAGKANIDAMYDYLMSPGCMLRTDWDNSDDYVVVANGSYLWIGDDKAEIQGDKNLVIDRFKNVPLADLAEYISDRVITNDVSESKNELFLKAGSSIGYNGKAYTLSNDLTVTLTLANGRSFGQDVLKNIYDHKDNRTQVVADVMELFRIFVESVLDETGTPTTLKYTYADVADVTLDEDPNFPNVISMCTEKAATGYQTGADKTEFLVLTRDGSARGTKRVVVTFDNSNGVVEEALSEADFNLIPIVSKAVYGASLPNTTYELVISMYRSAPDDGVDANNNTTRTYDVYPIATLNGTNTPITGYMAQGLSFTVNLPTDGFADNGDDLTAENETAGTAEQVTVANNLVTLAGVSQFGKFTLTKPAAPLYAIFQSVRLAVEGKIGLCFTFKVPDTLTPGMTAEFKYNNSVVTATLVSSTDDGEYTTYEYVYWVPPAEDRRALSLKLFDSANNPIEIVRADNLNPYPNNTVSYSVYDYLNVAKTLVNSSALAVKILNYCEYARKHFNVDNTIAFELEALTATISDVSAYAFSMPNMPSGVEYKGNALELLTDTYLYTYFTASGNHSYTIDNVAVEPTEASGYQIIVSNGIPAAELDEYITIGVDGMSFQYSPLSYVYTVLNNSDHYAGTLVDLVKALYEFNDAANTYWH